MTRTLEHLFDRNVAWAQDRTRDDPDFFRRSAEQQTPGYLWIGCSDSRVSASDVLGLDPGEVFVRRNIANVIHTGDMNILSVLTFAIDHLKVEHVIVCGHYGCGGVRHALAGGADGLLASWLQPIAMLHRRHRATFDAIAGEPARIDRMCEINVEMQVRRLAATPTVEHAWARGQAVQLHGWVYGIQDGLLRDLGPHQSSIAERDALAPVDHRVALPAEPVSAVRRQAIQAFGGV